MHAVVFFSPGCIHEVVFSTYITQQFFGLPYYSCGIFLDVRVTICQVQSHCFIVRYLRLEDNVCCTCAALQMMIVYFPDENSIIIMFFTYYAHPAGLRTTVVM